MKRLSDQGPSWNDFISSPEGLADHIAEMLDCPITIEDSYHRIVSYSKHEKNVDQARIETIMNRKVPEHVINGLWKSGVMSNLYETDIPVIIEAIPEIGLGSRIAISVQKDKEILGFIWAESKSTSPDEAKLQLLQKAADMVRIQLIKHQANVQKAEENDQEFFWQLLVGHLNKEDMIQQKAQRFGLNLNGQLAVAIITFADGLSQKTAKHAYYLTEATRDITIVCRVFDQNRLILLVKLEETPATNDIISNFIQNFIVKIRERLHVNYIYGACGILYTSPTRVKDSYQQALKVLHLKGKFKRDLKEIHSYQHLGVYQFIEELTAIREQTHYQNQTIQLLRHYDQKHGTELLQTLKTFLECDSNVQRAAKVIHVHANTLNYRLKRITEITDIDLKDPNQKTTLYLDFKIEYLQKG